MSDPKGEKPHPEHPQEDDMLLDFSTQHEEGTPLAELHEQGPGEVDALQPLFESGINASSDEFQFPGPVEELDFTEPADFPFPSEPTEGPAASDSSADMAAVENAGAEHRVTEETPAAEAAEGEPRAVAGPAAEAPERDLAGKEEEKGSIVEPKRELPAWVHALEWTTVGLLSVGLLIALLVSILWIDAKTATLVLTIAFPVMLLLVPYSLWRSSRRWVKPRDSALYTVLLAVSAAALICGTWFEGIELAHYEWQFNKSRLAAGKPRQNYIAPVDPPPTAPETK